MNSSLKQHMLLIEGSYVVQHQLREAYEDRVAQTAEQMLQFYKDNPVTKEELKNKIMDRAKELPLGSLKHSEFAMDVIKHLGKQIKIQRKTPAASARNLAFQRLRVLIPVLASSAESELGSTFPDGDPHDVGPKVARSYKNRLLDIMYDLGSDGTYTEWFFDTVWPKVQQEFKKQNKGKDMYAVLADWWDSQRADHVYDAEQQSIDPEEYLHQRGFVGRNPYR
jgi:hypothetical protein